MKSEYRSLRYKEFKKRMVLFSILCWIIPIIYFLTKENIVPINWGYLIFPALISFVLPVLLSFFRKIFLGCLIGYELDMHTVYELEKREKNHEIYNLKLLVNKSFYDGDFEDVISIADKILNLSLKNEDIFFALHNKILSLFLIENNNDILMLIQKQRQLFYKNKHFFREENLYYIFIEKYLQGQYEEAIENIKKILDVKNIETQNHKRVVVNYFMMLAHLKNTEFDKAQYCENEILIADRNHRTFFSKNNGNSGDGSIS